MLRMYACYRGYWSNPFSSSQSPSECSQSLLGIVNNFPSLLRRIFSHSTLADYQSMSFMAVVPSKSSVRITTSIIRTTVRAFLGKDFFRFLAFRSLNTPPPLLKLRFFGFFVQFTLQNSKFQKISFFLILQIFDML